MFLMKGMLYLKAWAARGGKILDKRNVFDKRNFVLESMGCPRDLGQVGSQMNPGNLNH